MLQQHGRARAKTKQLKLQSETCQNLHMGIFMKFRRLVLHVKKRHVKNEWESGHQNANYVADNMLQNENVKNQLRLLSLLAQQNAIVRQTIGIAVRKRTRHHGQIQVRTAIFRIVLSLGKK